MVPMSKPLVPQTALDQYMPITTMGKGKDGTVFLALPRKGSSSVSAADPRASLVALKVVAPDQRGTVSLRLLERIKQLPAPENSVIPPLVRVRDFHQGQAWYVMDLVPGGTVQQLLSKYDGGVLPPFLIFHLFVEVCRAERFLFGHGLCHRDLKLGGNVILRSDVAAEGLPAVTLVDYGDIYDYTPGRRYHVCEQMVGLLQTAMGISDRGSPGGEWRTAASEDDVTLADKFFAYVDTWGDIEGGRVEEDAALDVVWEKWGGVAERLRKSLRSEAAVTQLETVLCTPLMEDQELKESVDKGGMKVEVSRFE